MRCQHITNAGTRCAEKRAEWLWLVQDESNLRYCCTSHLRGAACRVRATAMCNWLSTTPEARDE